MEQEKIEPNSSSGSSDFISLSNVPKTSQDFGARNYNEFLDRNYRGGYRGRGNFHNPYEFNRPQHFYNNQPRQQFYGQNFGRGQRRPWSQQNQFRQQRPRFSNETNQGYQARFQSNYGQPRYQSHSAQSDDISLYVHPSTFEDPWAEFFVKEEDYQAKTEIESTLDYQKSVIGSSSDLLKIEMELPTDLLKPENV